jgi:hypothetical protein
MKGLMKVFLELKKLSKAGRKVIKKRAEQKKLG